MRIAAKKEETEHHNGGRVRKNKPSGGWSCKKLYIALGWCLGLAATDFVDQLGNTRRGGRIMLTMIMIIIIMIMSPLCSAVDRPLGTFRENCR